VGAFISLIDAIRSHAERSPDKTALAYLYGADDSGVEGQPLSYGALDHSARSIAAWLRQRYLPGDRAMLLFPAGLEFTQAFLGCLYAGVVPAPSPLTGNDKRQIDRTMAIARDAEVALVLTTAAAATTMGDTLRNLATRTPFDLVAFDEAAGDATAFAEPPVTPDSVALLQYTSGSISEPKGVMVTHANLADNLSIMDRLGSLDRDCVAAHWLPHFHDMGLIGMLLHALNAGGTTAFMSPITFLKRPARWLEAMSHWRATHTTAPDFGYELCARVVPVDQVEHLDLSTLTWALNGAEPVRASTLARFSRRFAPIGLRPNACSPCYGMAESTLLVSATLPQTAPVCYSADRTALEQGEVRPATGLCHWSAAVGRTRRSCVSSTPATWPWLAPAASARSG
jgi:acyl-CoA synthetase (AMP-forming)/AMP-acid ligase II